jgi:hypothetical protein
MSVRDEVAAVLRRKLLWINVVAGHIEEEVQFKIGIGRQKIHCVGR